MKPTIIMLILLPFAVNGQSVHSNMRDAYGIAWMMRLNADSSVLLVCDQKNESYDEYTGFLQRTSSGGYMLKAKLVYSQAKCRAIGDSILYVTVDSTVHHFINTLEISYSGSQVQRFPVSGKQELYLRLDSTLLNRKGSKGFKLSSGHMNPLTQAAPHMQFRNGEEFCADFYAGGSAVFELVMQKGVFTRITRKNN